MLEIIFLVLVSDVTENLAWIAHGNHVGRYVFGYNAARANHGILTNGYSWTNNYPTANPNIILNGYRK